MLWEYGLKYHSMGHKRVSKQRTVLAIGTKLEHSSAEPSAQYCNTHKCVFSAINMADIITNTAHAHLSFDCARTYAHARRCRGVKMAN